MNIGAMKKNNKLEIFGYGPDGFSYKSNDKVKKIEWLEIDVLTAYKADLLTYDEICLEIVCGDLVLTITEETPGWANFVLRTKSIFPSIPVDWDSQIVQPAFATNQTTLYQKEDHYKILADFNNMDVSGRVRLNTIGSLEQIHKLKDNFKESMYVLLGDEEGNQIFGRVKYSDKEGIWVAEIDKSDFISK